MEAERSTIRSYGRRKGKKLHSLRQAAYDHVLPEVCIVLRDSLSPESLFGFPVSDVWLEIGFGNGEHLTALALQHPDIGFIGCEPFVNGVAALCRDIEKHGIKNIRIFPDDARLLMARIAPGSIGRCFLLNADPWPKKRHHKRRFIRKETLDALHALLKPGAEFRVTTDDPGLADWSLEQTCAHPGFSWTAQCAADWRTRPADAPETRYQKKLLAGHPVVFLNFRILK